MAASISAYLNACARASEIASQSRSDLDEAGGLDDALHIATIAVSLLGFLEAAAAQADFWRAGGRLALVQRLQRLLNESFLIAAEKSFSTIRNSHSHERDVKDWKRYLRHYFDIGRPLGSILLQQGLMTLVAVSTSLLVAETSALKKNHILDLLMSGEGLLRPVTARSADGDSGSAAFAKIVGEQLGYLDADADFIQMGSPSQQKTACAIKAYGIVSYLNCSRLNETAADLETLVGWLEETIADPFQMEDENLAAIVLRAMAFVCRMSPVHAANTSRLISRFIVKGGAESHIIVTASECLAFVLRMLSTDAVITTLYTLGNVLSPTTELNGGPKHDFGIDSADEQIYAGRQSTGSDISLQLNGEEEMSKVYENVIDAICGIATACKDEKLSALAQSILLQKYDRINQLVDARIINAAAVLALSSGQLEFRSLLKSFVRIANHAVAENQTTILDAVSILIFHLDRAIY